MNPANFTNVGGGMPGGAKAQGQMQAPQKSDNQLLNFVGQALQNQGSFPGWRADVLVKDRAVNVYQMLTSLRLIQPRVDLNSAAQAALSFELKAFKEAREKADYDKECTEKLAHIRDTRARQAAVMQNGMMPQAGPGAGMPGVGQAPFPQQMNRPVQASPMPGQQQMAMNITDQNQQAAMQHRQQPQPQQSQQPQQSMLQRPNQRPNGGAAFTDELSTLSPQDFDHVRRIADQIIAKTPQEDVEKIKINLQNMTPQQKQYLANREMDPVSYFFRSQALNQLRRHKRVRMEMNRAQNAGVDPNTLMNDPMIPPQQRQMFQNMINLQRNSGFPVGNQQHLDQSSFIGNVENIQGQQADGLRSQEAGQLVVPASSSQMNQPPFPAQNMYPGQPGQANMNGTSISPQFFAQQQLQSAQNTPNAQNAPQDRTQAPQFQPHSQSQTQAQAHARAQAAQKAQMAISQAGQANSHMQQQISQPSPAMPMLNRPMAPGQLSPAQVPAQVRPPSRPPGMGQQPTGVQSLGGQPAMQGRPQIPRNLPQSVQEQMSQMTTEQIQQIMLNYSRNQNLARGNNMQQSIPTQQNMPQSSQGQQMANGQLGNNQNMRASLNLQQQLAGMGAAQQKPNQLLQGQQLSAHQRQQQLVLQQRQQEYKSQLMRQQNGVAEMSPEQMKDMDRLPFPKVMFNNNQAILSLIPEHIKTWGQLKQYTVANQQALGGMDPHKLMLMQKYHLTQILAQQQKEVGRNPAQGGQGPWMPVPFQGQQQPMMNSQQPTTGQQQQASMMPFRPITAQDIQTARQRLGVQAQNFNDDQIRDLLQKNRQRQWSQMTPAQRQSFLNQSGQRTQPTQQPPVTAPMATPQVKPEPQPQHFATQSVPQNQPIKTQAAAPGKGPKGTAAKQPPKRKLPNEELVEQPQNTPPQQQPTQPAASQEVPAPALARPNLPISREQLAAMTPQQRAQLEAHVRRQQNQPRVPITRAAAEEAWNNLPEKTRHWYNELANAAPPEQPHAVTPEQKATMTQQLLDSTDMLGRMDTLVQWFGKIPGQEKSVRGLFAMRIQLMRQFKPGPEWVVNDHFTIAPEYASVTINYIKKLFHAMITRVNQHQNQNPGQRPGAAQSPSNMSQPGQTNMPALNASNLQQLQQQEEAIQRARRASSQTAVSATSVVPPAPFGAPSPQGVPHAYGPGSMPPEQLKLPPPKKRKQSHPGAAPVAGIPSAKAQAIKQAVPDAKSTVANIAGAFKCSVPECQHHYHGFTSQHALDKHVEENHKVEESIENPLEFALESFRSSLVKDEGKPDAQGARQGGAMDTPQMSTRLEGVAPATTGTTPMGRVPSQLGPKAASPASHQQLNPRAPPTKATGPTAKPTRGQEGKKEAGKSAEQEPPVDAKDPWVDSSISLEAIHDTFMDFGDDGGLGFGAMDEFLNADMFSNNNTLSKDTPDSIETAAVTQTPNDNDILKNDGVPGKSGQSTDDNWIPVDWFNLPGRFEDGLLMNDSWDDIDWETLDRKESTMNVDDSGIAICAM